MNPQERATKDHQRKNQKLWRSKAWKKAKVVFLEGKICAWCGRPPTVPHHPSLRSYGKPEYINLYLSGCIPLCQSCHFAIHRGLLLCPKCKRRYRAPHNETCWTCRPLKERQEILARREATKIRRRKAQREARKRYQRRSKCSSGRGP